MSSPKQNDQLTKNVSSTVVLVAGEKQADPISLDVEPDSESDASQGVSIPWTYKWIALLCVVSFPIGQTWTNAALSPLKNTLRNELGITNTQFGIISSADAIFNSIWPILGGILLDWYGPNIIIPMCTTVIFVGSVIAACGINIDVWRMLAAGNILMGLGIAVLDSAQQKLFYHWFVLAASAGR